MNECGSNVGCEENLCFLNLWKEVFYRKFCIRIDTQSGILRKFWKERTEIFLYLLDTHTNGNNMISMAFWTRDRKWRNSVALMADKAFMRNCMIGKGDVTMRTFLKKSTVLANPGTTISSSTIEKEDFFSFL